MERVSQSTGWGAGLPDDENAGMKFRTECESREFRRSPQAEAESLRKLLKDVMTGGKTPRSRTRAAYVCSQILFSSAQSAECLELYNCCKEIPTSGLSISEMSEFLLAKTSLAYMARVEKEYSEVRARLELQKVGTRQAGNSQSSSRFNRKSSRLRGFGRRSIRQCPFLTSNDPLRLAERLGDERPMSQIASNLALANGRLGRYDEQLRWAGSRPRPR